MHFDLSSRQPGKRRTLIGLGPVGFKESRTTMEQKDFRKILKSYLGGSASEQEKEIVEKWYDEMARERLDSDEADDAKLEEQYLTTIMKHVERKPGPQMLKPTAGFGMPGYFFAIAASVVLLIVSFFVITNRTPERNNPVLDNESPVAKWKQVTNASSIAQRYTLADGSSVTLEPNSNIKFSTLFNLSMREVHLEGQGFFEVTHSKDKPFFVFTNDVTTRVLGTSFTIRSFREDRQVTVVVKTGKVSVFTKSPTTSNPTEEFILTPNQEITYDRAEKVSARRIVKKPQPIVSVEEMERMRFEEAPLREVLEAIEKVYGVNIDYSAEKFASCTLTTSVSGGGLYNRLDIITSAIGATYELKEDRIVIKGAGCNYPVKK